MRKIFLSFIFVTLLHGCKNNAANTEADDSTLPGMLGKYPMLELPYTFADSNLTSNSDTVTIRYSSFIKMIPDSVLKAEFGNEKKLKIKPIGQFKKGSDETFIITMVAEKGKSAVYVQVFVKDSFAASLPLLVTDKDNISRFASVDRYYNIEKKKTWTTKGEAFYERQVFAYSGAGTFTTVLNETNVNRIINADIYNPLDSMPKTFAYSGDYRKDKNNFISISDGSHSDHYKFFVHFEKKGDEPCGGEMRGEFKMQKDKEGIFVESGTTCIINFLFSGNRVLVKEQGSCGNHRGIKCFFDDTYTKKKSPKAAMKK